MFPFGDRKLRWFLRDRYSHLVADVEADPPSLDEPHATSLRRRVRALKSWGRVRGVVLVLLSFGVIATVTATVLQYVRSIAEAQDLRLLVEWVAAWAGALSGALTIAALLLTRLLAQLEIDILLLLRKTRLAKTSY